MYKIFVDLEMNPISSEYIRERTICSSEIIEIGAVALDDYDNEVASFQEYVRPYYSKRMTRRCRELTGISTDLISRAASFENVFSNFTSWCRNLADEYTIYAWSKSDLNQIIREHKLKNILVNDEMKYMTAHWEDFQNTYSIMTEASHALSLRDAMDMVGLSFEGYIHNALYDARNTSRLYLESRDSENLKRTIETVSRRRCSKPTLTCTLGDLINFSQFA